MKPLRIVFAGTPDFSVPALQALIAENFSPLAVLTQPDRPAGRGRKLQSSPIKQAACSAEIPVLQPDSLRDPKVMENLRSWQPDLMIVVAYGLILPPEVLAVPSHGCWNIHASLLPRWRGAAPIQRAIEAGDSETGVCIMQMDEGLDTGDILLQKSIQIEPDETGGSLHDKLAELGADALIACVKLLAQDSPPVATAQPKVGHNYAAKLKKAEAELDWSLPAIELERMVRAFNPWPVAWCNIGGERTRIWAAIAIKDNDQSENHTPGTLVSTRPDCIEISTGEGLLRVLSLQKPGGRALSAAEYLNSNSLPGSLATPG